MTNHILHRHYYLLHLQERPEYDRLVLLKEPAHELLSGSQIAQLHNEYVMTSRLAHVRGVRPIFAMEGSESHPILILKYVKGQSLLEIIQGQVPDSRSKLQLAVDIAVILGRIHQEGVVHRDLCSSNIIVAEKTVSSEPDEIYLIDFGLAVTVGQKHSTPPLTVDAMAGDLAYVAPEQTGRMRHSVGYRSDLYSLGVILYELFTGQLPFQADEALQMLHAHLAVEPVPPRKRNATIPEPISQIILKLMAKDPKDRYQSAAALVVDLVRCLDQYQLTESVTCFELGQDDLRERLRIPHTLYGRQTEISKLIATYDCVAQGNTRLLFVSGYSGVGKTSLVHEIRGDVQARGGVFVEGKFDQLEHTLPYSALAQAVTQLVNSWLTESEATLGGWKETILDAVGDHGQILIDIVPALERIIGPQQELPRLGGIESQNRLSYCFNCFVTSLATQEHPLVLFLDDLQWIDRASLRLITGLNANIGSACLLIIGAFRVNEVGADHPLMVTLDEMRAQSNRVQVISLEGLAPIDLEHMLADTFQFSRADCRPVAQILMDKTAGNPFHVRQLLYALESAGSIRFDRKRRSWTWRDDRHQSLQAGANVVDLMISSIQALPVETQCTMSVAACIGSRFEMPTLCAVTGHSEVDLMTSLSPALELGLIVQSGGQFTFGHDRIQEACYSLIPRSDRPERHRKLGRLLLENTAADNLDAAIFAIAGHLNAGRACVEKDSELVELAALNLKAGQKAKTASAYAEAKEYIEIGLSLLDRDSWQGQYELTLSLQNENAELASLTGQLDQIASAFDEIQANARSIYDQIPVYMTRIETETTQYNFARAMEIGLEVLRDLGIEIPLRPSAKDQQRLKNRYVSLLTRTPMARINQLPEMSDARALAACSLLASMMSTSYIAVPPLFPIISYNGAILTLEFGLDAWSPFFFGGTALVILASIDRETPADEAHQLVQLSRQLAEIIRATLEKPVTARSKTKGLMMLAFIVPWIEPIGQSIEISLATFHNGNETGDLLYGSYGTIHFAIQSLAAGMNLSLYEAQLSDFADGLGRQGQKTTAQWLLIYAQTARNFIDTCSEPDELNGVHFVEADWLPIASAAVDISGMHFLYINKLMLAYYFDMDHKLGEYAELAEKFLTGALSLFTVPLFHFYLALAKLRAMSGSDLNMSYEAMNLIDKSLHWMEIWSITTPSTFQHKYDLVSAERARITGNLDGALFHYEQAIKGAREAGFTHEEALANELYGRFWAERGNTRFATLFMREAYSLYRKWGALAKAEHLSVRYPDLTVSRAIAIDEPRLGGVVLDQIPGELDLVTVLQASQAITSEIELGRLLGRLMNSVIENSGAQFGYMLLQENGQWMIAAQSGMDMKESQVDRLFPTPESDQLSTGIVNYVARTQRTVLLEDASRIGEFVDDPHIQRNEVKSLLCTPLVNQGLTSAILYLENNLTTNVFTKERVALLQLLSSQMAMSIDNARTHDQLERLLEERSIALREAETQIRSLFDSSPVGIALSTLEGEFLSVNRALLRMLRISEEQVSQRNVVDFYAISGERAPLLAEVRESGAVQNFGVQLKRNDGSTFFASLSISRIVLEGTEVLLAMVEDVTDELSAKQELAAIEERERLARELHDSVSQTLFSAGMIADAIPRLSEKDSELTHHNLRMLSGLIRGASAEMRSLLLELRPDTLKDQSLGTLLETLAVVARARTQAAVSVSVEDDHLLPEHVTLNLHRIAQESLSNIAKHAEASEIVISLSCSSDTVRLSITDDGRGFDPQTIPAGHLGVGIMRERAHSIGATFQIHSKPGAGTSIVATWTKPSNGGTDERHRSD